LKPDHQDIIILRFVEELSVREAAHALGRSEGAVKLLQHRAMRELQKHLRQPVTILGDPELTTEQPWK
jgi:RNA polymerase sigma-70 factor (ECF subfamily)